MQLYVTNMHITNMYITQTLLLIKTVLHYTLRIESPNDVKRGGGGLRGRFRSVKTVILV